MLNSQEEVSSLKVKGSIKVSSLEWNILYSLECQSYKMFPTANRISLLNSHDSYSVCGLNCSAERKPDKLY